MPARWILNVAAVATGALVAVVAVVSLSGPRESSADADAGRAEDVAVVRVDFLRRWETWRRATLRFTETTDRSAGDQHLQSTVTVAQRFPDRIVRDGADVSAHIGARLIGCSTPVGGPPTCTDSGGYRPDEELTLELEEFSTLTAGPQATYRISRLDGNCFRIRHVVDEFRPRWGDRMDVCFGAGTGAVTREQTTAGAITTTVERRDIVDSVTDADFALPAQPVPSVGNG